MQFDLKAIMDRLNLAKMLTTGLQNRSQRLFLARETMKLKKPIKTVFEHLSQN